MVAESVQSTPVANSVPELLSFQPYCFRRLAEVLSDDPDDPQTYIGYGRKLARTTMSTAFSGIGAPETSAFILVCWLLSMANGALGSVDDFSPILRAAFAIEFDAACREELLFSPCVLDSNDRIMTASIILANGFGDMMETSPGLCSSDILSTSL